jgi:hypothetical protein
MRRRNRSTCIPRSFAPQTFGELISSALASSARLLAPFGR